MFSENDTLVAQLPKRENRGAGFSYNCLEIFKEVGGFEK